MPRCLIIMICAFSVYFSVFPSVHAQESAEVPAGSDDSVRLLINIPARWIRLYRGDSPVAAYPIAVGAPSTPTPAGDFKIIDKEVNPTWIDPDDLDVQIPSGEENPLGYRWMGIGGNYGIHGTNRPNSIGKFVSNGCIRVNEKNVEALFRKVSVGTPVRIVYDRLVVEKAGDGSVVYYIYPDAYNMQPLTAENVDARLKEFGVDDFADSGTIDEELTLSNGTPIYVGYPVELSLESQPLSIKAVKNGNAVYIPAYALSDIIGLALNWDEQTQTLSSKYGRSAGIMKKDTVYINVLDLEKVFNLQRDWQRSDFLILRIMTGSDAQARAAADLAAAAPKAAIAEKTAIPLIGRKQLLTGVSNGTAK